MKETIRTLKLLGGMLLVGATYLLQILAVAVLAYLLVMLVEFCQWAGARLIEKMARGS